MSTNYFAPPTIAPPRIIDNPAQSIAPSTLGPPTAVDETYGALVGQLGYGERAQKIKELGTGAGSIYERYMGLIRDKRNATASSLSGYGGISFKPNDPATPNRDESLEIQQETGRVGERERSAYDEALFRSLQTGGVGRAQLIGAALQRVSKEAQDIIAQYANSITNTDNTGYGDLMLKEQNAALDRWRELYGADSQQFLKELSQKEQENSAPSPSASRGQSFESQVRPGEIEIPGIYRMAPNMNTLRSRYSNMNLRVIKVDRTRDAGIGAQSDQVYWRVVGTPKTPQQLAADAATARTPPAFVETRSPNPPRRPARRR
jgi:hypothetical protein